MEKIKLKLAIRTDIKNKPTDDTLKLTACGWSNVNITLPHLIESISNGFPFTHQFSNGYRRGANFAGTNVIISDIDGGLPLSRALDLSLHQAPSYADLHNSHPQRGEDPPVGIKFMENPRTVWRYMNRWIDTASRSHQHCARQQSW